MSNKSVSYLCYLIRHNYSQLRRVQHDIKKLVLLAFSGSIGMTLVILGCALPQYEVWWPFFVVLFYILAPIPTIIARRYTEDPASSSNPCLELAIFITIGFVVSSFALPIVLARAPDENPVIHWGACYLTLAGNVIVYLTLVGFFVTFEQDDVDYNMW
ncbi:leptin receptor gene-related protein isoform X1 [Vespula pensylvanica]|uniref:leptin receptor gene-related protein isoform X1 n=1 Tax=Vespula pensylvanica TaxID=30213 RepID=UPI001CBA17ED|nr:leptin receptor gene-related protein isoform X1 [Vespula pensylvanica]